MRDRRTGTAGSWTAAALAVALVATTSGWTWERGATARPACSVAKTPAAPPTGPTAPAVPDLSVTGDVATGLDTPWGVAPLPNGDVLVASRDNGTISRFTPGKPGRTEVGSVPGSEHDNEGGLLGIALSPRFAFDRWVYIYTSAANDNRILRMRYLGGRLVRPEVLVTGIPSAGGHNGGRIAFGPDCMLYAGTGEAGNESLAQDPNSLGGKILRMTPEGKPARGNPFPGSLVYSLGHRNVQGLAWDSAGRLWASEFGASTWDELNLIVPGGNYGWPNVEGTGGAPTYIDPLTQWTPAEASPSGIAIVDDVIYVAALRGQRLWQVPIEGTKLGQPKAYFQGTYGRLRTVLPAPGGGLWVTTSNTDGRGDVHDGDDRVLRVTLG
ncbi:PQQ-dependent sugar dehydrogenase [Yinghuangia seranimata]|uniref:PQQ-dependent sugar dehydrogenase n=1 Tax=Yinghuangia seranimata TaxID=408067 RepID=UPI00248C2BBB|nr:PQQ-dependent sugar dehydrogenase [Yinghuangia seranimata]MDI2127591.1 PQQ-dependent sugar dehydrogenase [Yinghuangia seranimata]